MKKLGINIDHIATIRNARGGHHPDPFKAARLAMKYGADSITIHLREDRRHIKDTDVRKICSDKKIIVNLEVSLNKSIINIALKNNPNFICIVPEKRKEITTEGGLDVKKNFKIIKKNISLFKKKGIRTSLFVNPKIDDIRICKQLETDCIELHTGKISNLIKSRKNYSNQLKKIKECSLVAKQLDLEVHAGHGMDYKTTKVLNKIKEIKEFNIGHFIIGEAIFNGLKFTIKKFKRLSNN